MDRPQHAALTDQEIEAFQNAFDHIPPPHAIQPRFRLNGLFKLSAFAAAFHVLSFGTIEPNEPPLIMTILVRDGAPSWTAFEAFPLVVKSESVWPLPDLDMPPLALKAPRGMVAIKSPTLSDNQIRLGDGPQLSPLQNGSATQMASSASTQAPPAQVKAPKISEATPKPQPQPKPATLFDTIVKSFNQATAQQKNAPSITGSRSTIESVRDTLSSFKGGGTPSPSPGSGGFFGGLRKG